MVEVEADRASATVGDGGEGGGSEGGALVEGSAEAGGTSDGGGQSPRVSKRCSSGERE